MDTTSSQSEADKAIERSFHHEKSLVEDQAGLSEISKTQPDDGSHGIPANHESQDWSTIDDDADILRSAEDTLNHGGSMSEHLRDLFRSLAQHQNCSCHLAQHPEWSEHAIDSTPGTPMLSSSDQYSSFGASSRGSFFGTRSGNLSHSDSFSRTCCVAPTFTLPQVKHFPTGPLWLGPQVVSQPHTSSPYSYPLDLDSEVCEDDIEMFSSDGKDNHDETATSVEPFVNLDSNCLSDEGDGQALPSVEDQPARGCASGSSMNPQVGSQRMPDSDGGNEKQDHQGNEVHHETQASKMIQHYLELAVSLKHAKDQLDELEVIYHTEVSESSSNSSAQQERERRIEYENQKALKSDHLNNTITSVGEARLSCIMNAAFDPLREHVVQVTDRIEPGETAIEDERLSIIREILKSFERDENSLWMVTPLLSPSLLRDVRAWARVYGFGYKTLVYGSDEQCSVLIHKNHEELQPSTTNGDPKTQLPDQFTSGQSGMSPYTQIHPERKHSITKPWASCENLVSASAGTPQDDSASCISRASVVPKKRRVAREDGAFNCLFPDCQKSFDRACDLAHHERIHCPKEDLPHACTQCSKRFLFAKDLRRHKGTHRMRG